MSGGPVFAPPPHLPAHANDPTQAPARCIAVVSGTQADKTGGKMGAVMPTHYAVQLIRQNTEPQKTTEGDKP